MRRGAYTLVALLALSAAAALLIAVGLPSRADYTGWRVAGETRPTAPEPQAYAPNFSAITLTGSVLQLDQLRGQPVILNFWATWCAPCRFELPELQRIHIEFSGQAQIIGINLGESAEQITPWADELGLTFPLALDENQRIAALYRLRVQPSTFIISPAGIITDIYYGAVSADQLRAALEGFS